MERTSKYYLSQRWEDHRTPTPEYAQTLMKQYGFRRYYRIERLQSTDGVHVCVAVQWKGDGMLNNRNKHFATELCREADIKSVKLRLQRDAFKKAFRHFPRVRKALWHLYQQDCKWAKRQAEIYAMPKLEYLNYCQFLP